MINLPDEAVKKTPPSGGRGLILQLKDAWKWPNAETLATDQEIDSFETETGLLIPPDMRAYFTSVNGSNGYDDGFFEFYPFDKFVDENKPAPKLYHLPSAESLNSIPNHCYFFADYQVHLLDYLIQLHQQPTEFNDIFICCGGELKLMARSFTEFISLCLADSQKLYFND